MGFAHSCGVLHADIHVINFLLDENLNLKVADFAGASVDGGISWSFYRLTHQLFSSDRGGTKGMKISIKSEIFAFGSALWSMVTGMDLWPELEYMKDRTEIVRRLRGGEMPDVAEMKVLGEVARKCWALEYESMQEVGVAVEEERLASEGNGNDDDG